MLLNPIKKSNKIFALLLAVVLIAAGLIIYSITNAQNYEGIFVNGVRQVLY